MNKLRNSNGETLIETLCALLVVVLVFLLLTTSVAVASRLNDAVRDTDLSFHYSTAEKQDESLSLRLTREGDPDQYPLEATEYEDKNGYVFYKK